MVGLGSPRLRAFYEQMERVIDWGSLATMVAALPEYQPSPQGGRPSISPLLMLKATMVGRWHNLADDALEDHLAEGITVRRFVGLNAEDTPPDGTSFCRFRERLNRAGLMEKINKEIVRQLDAAGVLVKEGTLVDATFIEARKGGIRDDGTPSRDPEAQYACKARKPYFGYKAHVAADQSGIVTDLRVSGAALHDARHFDELTANEKIAVFADSIYHKKERRGELLSRGVFDGIMYQRRRGQAHFTPYQMLHNRAVATIRVAVEHVFARLKRMIGPKTRFRGMTANRKHLWLSVMALNLKRAKFLRTQLAATSV
jgi:IS5 family transposase